jgi:hypothetical protein
MRDPISAILTSALDDAELAASSVRDELGAALDASVERRETLAREGVRVDESPYLHFLRRFAGETAAPAALAASA